MNSILHCNDVYFDENLESISGYTPSCHPAHLDIVVSDAQPHDDDNVEQTGSLLWFCNKKSSPHGLMQTFAKVIVQEEYEIDVHAANDDSDDEASIDSNNDMPALIARYDDDSNDEEEEENIYENNPNSTQQSSYPESINVYDQETDTAILSPPRYP
ncbi:hypothetical protein IV203_014404 [Nitzschia inconspicua]|uniref:Uncharacterized protein n=1 Tax=Nitzschia inconspicua TaxID=303405 RepID=A0A9K3L8W8_9STRA|nr:hypothetical protein IV203_014404 [Nitzschia inconspicua]